MARVVLWGSSALEVWGRQASRGNFAHDFSDEDFKRCIPTAASTRYAFDVLSELNSPLHVMVASHEARRNREHVRCHVAPPSLKAGRFSRIAPGIYLPQPEIALLQFARGRSLPKIVAEGTKLCGSFSCDPDTGATKRRPPLSSIAALKSACSIHGDVPGRVAVRRALPWIMEGAASPREIALGLLMSLPHFLGGYALARPVLNQPLELGVRGLRMTEKSYYVADLCWAKNKLVLEYDSDEHHLASQQLHDDAVKRMVLESLGYRVVTVTRLQMNSTEEMNRVAATVAHHLSIPVRFRVKNFPKKQRELRRAVGL